MLRRWSLENFKPVNGSVDLELGMVTVFAGLNSSGKSSVLQSILLVSQTLGNPNADKVLVLNGPILQLGTFDGVLNERAALPWMRVGFELDMAEPRQRVDSRGVSRTSGRVSPFSEQNIRAIRAGAIFGAGSHPTSAPSAIEAVRVVLSEASLEVDLLDEQDPAPRRVKAQVRPLGLEEETALLADIREGYRQFIPCPPGENYAVELVGDGGADPLLTRLAHFLPHRLIFKFNVRERKEKELMAVADLLFDSAPPSAQRSSLDPRVSQVTALRLSADARGKLEALSRERAFPPPAGESVASVLEWLRAAPLKGRARASFAASVRRLVLAELTAWLRGSAQGPDHGLDILSGSPLATASEHCINYFTAMIRYLGPLRADPQAAQGFAPSSEPDDVGPRGEHAAAVFDANRRQQIIWWDPVAGREAYDTLEEAVDRWLRYLGVAHHVLTREAGLSGTSWRIQQTAGSQERPLHAVGVGVSQVLPILVAGLLAPQGAMLLIEQPELHLHERAQARLGDFFVGLAQVGKQCIIETHSVCLVNQLRLHRAHGLAQSGVTRLYFAHQDELGDAHFVPVEISPSGNILNWPDGFFDEANLQEDRITRAGLKARARVPQAREG